MTKGTFSETASANLSVFEPPIITFSTEQQFVRLGEKVKLDLLNPFTLFHAQPKTGAYSCFVILLTAFYFIPCVLTAPVPRPVLSVWLQEDQRLI